MDILFPLWLLFNHQSCVSAALHAQERINRKKNVKNKIANLMKELAI